MTPLSELLRLPTVLSLLTVSVADAQDAAAPWHGTRPASIEIRNVHVIRGDGAPATGPRSVWIRDGVLVGRRIEDPEVVLDGSGCYALPGLVSTHAHLHQQQGGIPIDIEYVTKLWLACGITAVRDNGSAFGQSLRLRNRERKGELAAPRIFLFRMFGGVDEPDAARERVHAFREAGADGIKLWSSINYPPEILEAILSEAQKVRLPVTAHIGVGPSDAVDYARMGVSSIEHWYGIPDAALPGGVQDFPAAFSYSNEVDRFREAGRIWQQADPARLDDVLATLVDEDVQWSPTLAIYEASRDLVRAQNKPWFDDYLHPALAQFFLPSLESHGSYFIGWTSRDEAAWRENYRIWMDALWRFAEFGGEVTTGEDAGYIYCLYGFTLIRELELQLEAGFHPLRVLQHATWHGAKALGAEDRFGRLLPGMAADLCVVHGNPLDNFKVFYPTGCDFYVDGESVRGGGVRWTIKDGIVYDAKVLAADVRQLVQDARASHESR